MPNRESCISEYREPVWLADFCLAKPAHDIHLMLNIVLYLNIHLYMIQHFIYLDLSVIRYQVDATISL